MYLGAHISISESIALAPSRGRSVGCETIQIFSRSPRMLRKTKPIPPEEAQAFQENMKDCSHPERLAVCIDTCHTFAAGYDFRTREGYDALLRDAEGTVGLSRVRAFHLNDSKGDLGSRADRHEDIGKGKLGQDPF